MPQWKVEEHNHFEADTLLTALVNELTLLFKDRYYFSIFTPDTDVVIIACTYLSLHPGICIDVCLMTSKGTRILSVPQFVEGLGCNTRALLGAYVLTGCDHIGSFAGISKARCFQEFLNITEAPIIEALSSLGNSERLEHESIENITKFVMILYCSKRKEDMVRSSTMKSIGDLRVFFYSKYQHEGDQLPPTQNALNFKIKRANYVCMMWKRNMNNLTFQVPPISHEHGWDKENGKLSL